MRRGEEGGGRREVMEEERWTWEDWEVSKIRVHDVRFPNNQLKK